MLRDAAREDIRTRALIGAQLASELAWHEDLAQKVAIAREAESLARQLGDDVVLARVLQCVYIVIEIVESGLHMMERSREMREPGCELGDDYIRFFGELNLITSAFTAGQFKVARETMTMAYETQSRLT